MQDEIADPYAVLGLSRLANADELKRAYRKLSMAWHPDRHASAPDAQRTEAERRFKLINAAYVAVGELIRGKDQAPAAQATVVQQSDSRIEAIRSVVASAALRLIPNLPRHSYMRIVGMVEMMLIDAVALGQRAFNLGFDAFVDESMILAGLSTDSREAALHVLDAAADDLQWRGKGADPETWQGLLRPLEEARRSERPKAAPKAPAASGSIHWADLLRPEPALVVIQGALAVLCILLLIPVLPMAGLLHALVLFACLAVLVYLTFGLARP